jgi:hypothetical protein
LTNIWNKLHALLLLRQREKKGENQSSSIQCNLNTYLVSTNTTLLKICKRSQGKRKKGDKHKAGPGCMSNMHVFERIRRVEEKKSA